MKLFGLPLGYSCWLIPKPRGFSGFCMAIAWLRDLEAQEKPYKSADFHVLSFCPFFGTKDQMPLFARGIFVWVDLRLLGDREFRPRVRVHVAELVLLPREVRMLLDMLGGFEVLAAGV